MEQSTSQQFDFKLLIKCSGTASLRSIAVVLHGCIRECVCGGLSGVEGDGVGDRVQDRSESTNS